VDGEGDGVHLEVALRLGLALARCVVAQDGGEVGIVPVFLFRGLGHGGLAGGAARGEAGAGGGVVGEGLGGGG